MKKLAIIVILSLCMIFVGCTNNTEKFTETQSETNVTETTEEASSNIPNAKEFPEIEWPTFGAATKIPTPDWSNHGEILVDSETSFWVQVGYTTLDDYTSYVKACQDSGFTNDYYNSEGYIYYGANSDGYAVQLTYNQYDHYVAIQVTANASEWDKWWLEETEMETR